MWIVILKGIGFSLVDCSRLNIIYFTSYVLHIITSTFWFSHQLAWLYLYLSNVHRPLSTMQPNFKHAGSSIYSASKIFPDWKRSLWKCPLMLYKSPDRTVFAWFPQTQPTNRHAHLPAANTWICDKVGTAKRPHPSFYTDKTSSIAVGLWCLGLMYGQSQRVIRITKP